MGSLFILAFQGFSQEYNDFDVRYQNNIKGDLTFISNNILNRDGGTATTGPNAAYDNISTSNNNNTETGGNNNYNDFKSMQYIDVDGDTSTFSSSTATFSYPEPDCNLIRYAGLYWSATYPSARAGQNLGTGRQNDFNQVKLKVPGGSYIDVTADEILYDGFTSTETAMLQNSPYACYADITNLITPLANPEGNYTIANVRSVTGPLSPGGGAAAGWTLVIVYENPTLSGKLITTFDGFARVRDSGSDRRLDVDYTGFNTVPSGPVRANIGAAALEGDFRISGDRMLISAASNGGFTTMSNATNPADNFFNSNITLNGALTTNRTPNSRNTLGYDTDIFRLNNPTNSVIPNAETAATFRFESRGDQYYPFFNSFNVEIIEPNIVLEKRVEDIAGNDITGQGVNLGQTLDYVLTFRNTGNDDGDSYIIRDVLPVNVFLDETNLTLPAGVTYVYDEAAGLVVFSIPNSLVRMGRPASTIRMRVNVASNCFDFVNACSDLIENIAYSTYQGVINDNEITDDPSVSDFDNCGFVTPGATNFLLDDLSDCTFDRTVQLCGDDVVLNAGDNFDSYIWVLDANSNGEIDASDPVQNDGDPDGDPSTLMVTDIGTYIVDKIVADPCKGFKEIITVERFGATQTNPLVDYFNMLNGDADPINDIQGEIVTCSVDGDLLPKIFLCGATDTQPLQINITDAQSLTWEKLDESSCTGSSDDCGNKNLSCSWNSVATGNNYTANTAGKFRLVINYTNGCFSRFYFDVFQNNLEILYNNRDIICSSDGQIRITNLGSGYGYQLIDHANNSILIPFTAGNGPIFDFSSGQNGSYRVEVVQLDGAGNAIPGACIFSTDPIGIRDRDFQVDITTTPANCNAQGILQIDVLNVRPNYTYILKRPDGTLIDEETAQPDNTYSFNVNPGNYIVEVSTDDGCSYDENVTVTRILDPTISALTTKDIGCTAGTIELTGSNGFPNPDYSFAIWSKNGTNLYPDVASIPGDAYDTNPVFSFGWRDTDSDGIDEYIVGEDGTYSFVIVDSNNCFAFSNEVTIMDNGPMTITPSNTPIVCSGSNSSTLNIGTSGGIGPFVYSIDDGATTQSTNTFPNLMAGTYNLRVTDASGCELTQSYTITQPFPLSASAGVSRDATCDPNGAEVRITNIVGGTSPYEYSFDGGANYGTSTVAILPPGDYIVIVRDDVGCSFPMDITVVNEPVPPTVVLTPEVSYLCDGNAVVTATPDITTYDYTFALDGITNSPDPTSNIFSDVEPGTYTVSTNYISQTPPTPSILLLEDFGTGVTISNPNTSGYFYEDQTSNTIPGGRPNDTDNQINDYEYAVTPRIVNPFGAWRNPNDHTNPSGTDGRFLVINVGTPSPGQIIYRKAINDIIPNRPISIELWLFNLLRSGNQLDPDLTIEIRNPGTDAIVQSIRTGDIPKNQNANDWHQFTANLNPGSNTTLDFVVRTEKVGNSGNDVAIDDIQIFQTPEVCVKTVSTPVTVVAGNRFEANITSTTNASCNGENDASVTFTATNFNTSSGFEYSTDGGTTFTTSTVSPVTTATPLSPGAYTFILRKVDEPSCSVSIDRTITEPAAVVASAAITTAWTCNNTGATITASANDGIAPYQYRLEDTSGGVIRTYQPETTFTNVTDGSYIVRVLDNNGCDDEIDTPINITAPATFTYTTVATQCYSGANDATITVTVSGGNGGLLFSINGNPFESPDSATPNSYVFDNLGSGSYTINVQDQFGCTAGTQTSVISPAVTVSASAPPIPECSNTTEATLIAAGGDNSFVYAIVADGATPSPSDFSAATTRTISAIGDYDVYARDKNGGTNFCEAVYDLNISKDDPLAVTVTSTPVLCSGTSQSTITIDATGGSTAYRYSINDGFTYQTTNTFPNLPAGSYNIRVQDSSSCEISQVHTISEPFTLSASALVAELIECNPSMGAEVRIVNARGGSAPYAYSFDGGATYQASNISNLFPGDYTVFVRDANNCSLPMDLTVLPAQTPPGVTTSLDYFCDGDATITVNPDDPLYDYTYEIDNVLNTPADSNVFTDVSAGTHIVTVNYVITTVIPPSTLLTEDFGFGNNTPITEIDPVYCYEPQDGTESCPAFGTNPNLQDGEYVVTNRLTNIYGTWISPNDHTGNTDGRYLAINVGGVAGVGGIVYAKRNIEVLQNQDISISLWAMNLLRQGTSGGDPSFEIQLVDPSGTIIASTTTGFVPKNSGPNDWRNYSVDLNPGSNPNLDIVIRTNSAVINGNDLAIDDLLATQPPAKCPAEVSVDVLVEAGRALEANITATTNISCNGASDGSVTFDVENFNTTTGYEYTTDGATFIGPETTSPLTLTGLSAGTTNITIRDVADSTCSVTISPNLSEPNTLTATATIISPSTCLDDATIKATPTGGTPAYSYQLEDTSATPIVLQAFQTSDTFTGLTPGDYIIRVRDINSCETTVPITVGAPDTVAFTTIETDCYSGNADAEITINVTDGNGSYQFNINGGPWIAPSPSSATTYTFTALGSGTYNVNVKDAYGCEGTPIQHIIEPEITVSATAANITACATTTDIIIAATGGDGNYVYAVVADGATPTATDFSNSNPVAQTAGDYDVYVRDNSGTVPFCEEVTDITIIQSPQIVIMPTVTDVTCNGASTGAIDVAITGGNAPYQYQLENTSSTILVAYQINTSFQNLLAGADYVVRVRDASGCDSTLPITITEPDSIVAEAEITKDYTCLELGEITVGSVIATTGGSGNYQYRINGGAWSVSTTGGIAFTDLDDDSYIIEVRDANAINCVYTIPTTVIIDTLPTEPTLITSTDFNCDGTGNITVSPNDSTYTYSIDGGTVQASNVFNNVAVGTHTITVDYGKSCTVDTDVIVEPGHTFTATLTGSTNVSCNGLSDGTATFMVTNFDPVNGFEYSIDNGTSFTGPETSATVTVSGLSAGTVNLVVRDVLSTSCSIPFDAVISQPAALVTTANITTAYTCDNGGATLTASISGGTPTYQYRLEDNVGAVIRPYQNNNTFTIVTDGTYFVRGLDANGCDDLIDAAIVVAAPANPTFDVTPTACYSGNNDAAIQLIVTSGNGGYQFSLNGGPWLTPSPSTATSYNFQNLSNGSYTVNVKDGFGCIGTAIPVTIAPQLTANAVLDPDLTCIAPGEVTVNANGGSGTYSYEWSDDNGSTYATTNFTGNVFSTTTDGTYIFRVTDTSAPTVCTVITSPVMVTPAELPIITSISATNIFCNGDMTGSLNVVIDTGIGNPRYTIEIIETNTSTNYGTQTSGLPAGDYEVRVTDDKGCTSVPYPISITEPNAITYNVDLVPITCNASSGTDPGSITVENLGGGTAEYTYHLTGNNGYSDTYVTTAGGEDHTFAILEFGIYEVDVVDANGCSARTTNIIASPPDDLDIDVSALTMDCTTGGMATVTVSSTVGSGNYEFATLETYSSPYSSTYQPASTPGGDTTIFTGLTPGITYTFVVHDITTNCYYFETAATPINSPSKMTASLDVVSNVTCKGAADGNVSFTFENYDVLATSVEYEIFNAQSNVPVGFNGSATVNPPTGAISITNFGTLTQGVYYILFKEIGGTNNGCSISSPDFTIIESSNVLAITASSPKNDNCNVDAGAIDARAQFGTAPYEFQYLLDTEPAPTASSVGWVVTSFANVESGDYIVYVKDANDCIQSDTVTVALDPTPDISLSIVDECVNEGNFEVLVSLDAVGISPYQISLNGGAFQNITFNGSNEYTVSGLSSGLGQTIEIRDLNGCSDMETFDIQPPLQFTIRQTALLDCEIGSAGYAEITIEVTSGSGNYEYEIDGPGSVDEPRAALPSNPHAWPNASAAGAYNVNIYDISTSPPNCVKSIIIDVPDAVLPEFSEVHTDVTCNGGADGSITVSETNNGINPLTYTLTPMPASAVLNGTVFENLPAGTYDLRGTGNNDCFTDIFGIVISEPTIITVPAPTVVEFNCTTGNSPRNATITISGASGGSGTFVRYEFINDDDPTSPAIGDAIVVQNGTNDSYTETNIIGGNYTINVYDDKGCIGTTTATIATYTEISNPTSTITRDVTCAPGDDAEVTLAVTVSPSSATPDLSYSVQGTNNAYNAPNQASDLFMGLGVGNYIGRITNHDTGCIVETVFEIKDPNTFEITSTTTDVVCFGDNGTVVFEINNPVKPYSGGFTWQVYNSQGTLALGDDTIITTTPLVSSNVGPTVPFALPAGSYRVDITQSSDPSCTAMDFFTIAGPSNAINATVDKTDVTCALNDGTITISNVSGGWADYTYYVADATAPAPTDNSGFVTTTSFSNLSGGVTGTDYQVWVSDAKGCLAQFANVNLIDPTAISADLRVNVANCDNIEGVLEVFNVAGGQGSNYTYQLQQFNGTTFVNTRSAQNTTIFNGLGEGRYQVVINDQWTCTFTTAEQVLYDEIKPLATVVKAIDCDVVSPGGEITVTQSGGSGNFVYTVAFPDGTTPQPSNTTGVFASLTEVGVYTFTITDQAAGHECAKTITQELFPRVEPVLQIDTFTNVTCIGDNDGTITVSTTDNGISPYTFEITAATGGSLTLPYAPSIATNLSATFTGLEGSATGITYTITGRGDNNCTTEITQTITQPDAIIADAPIVVQFGCTSGNNPNNASIEITGANGGSNNFVTYEFINNDDPTTTTGPADPIQVYKGSNSKYIETNAMGGTYTINVYDDKGCVGTQTATINTYDELLSASAAITNFISCSPGNDGEITVSVISTNSDASKFEYSIDNGATYQTSNVFPNLGIGTHNFLVRHLDTGCITTTSERLLDPNTFTIDITKISDVVCFGTATGEITLELVDATYPGGFDWEIFNTNGTPANTGDDTSVSIGTEASNGPTAGITLPAGAFYVIISQNNAPTCENMENFTISGPTAAITGDTYKTDVTCALNDGSIEVIDVLGGWGGYSYFVDIATNPAPADASVFQNSPLFENLSGSATGTDYQIWVTDSNGCLQQLPNVNLIDPTPISADLQVNVENCTNFEGEIQVVNVLGGQGSNYSYQLQRFNTGTSAFENLRALQVSTIFGGLGAGQYQVLVSDQWNCTNTTSFSVNLYEEIMPLATVVKPIDCTTDPGGQITITQTGGSSGNFTYTVVFPDSSTPQPSNTTGIFNNLTQEGEYTFTITDDQSCSKTIRKSLQPQVDPILSVDSFTDVVCFGDANGTISVSVLDNGVGPYTFQITDRDGGVVTINPTSSTNTSAEFTGLAQTTTSAGYTITATGSNDCQAMTTQTIDQPASAVSVPAPAPVTFSCTTGNKTDYPIIDIIGVTGGSGIYVRYEFINNDNPATVAVGDAITVQNGSNSSYTETNLAGGNYTINIYDSKGCMSSTTTSIAPFVSISDAVVNVDQPVSCATFDENITVSVTVVPAFATPNLEYVISGINVTYNQTNNTGVFTGLGVGNYAIAITNLDTGCRIDTVHSVADPKIMLVSATKLADEECLNDATSGGRFEVTIDRYTGSYDYQVFDSNDTPVSALITGNTAASFTVNDLVGGSYYVNIIQTDAPRCEKKSNTITISAPTTPITIVQNELKNPSCTNDQGVIFIDPSGGYGPYTIELNNTTTTQVYTETNVEGFVFQNLAAGDYTVVVTDTKNCVETSSITLIRPEDIAATISATPLSCFNGNTASVTATVNTVRNVSPTYRYRLNVYNDASGTTLIRTSVIQTGATFNNLNTGFYSITISDDFGCSFETPIENITNPTEVVADLIRTSPLTCTTGVELELSASGGISGSYEYRRVGTSTWIAMTGNSVILPTTGVFNADSYRYEVRDAVNSCPAVASNTIVESSIIPLTLTLDTSAAVINCNGDNTALIFARAAGGLGNYRFELYDNYRGSNQNSLDYTQLNAADRIAGPVSDGTFDNLSAGTYYVNVLSDDCTTQPQRVVINEPDALSLLDPNNFTDVSCNGSSDGTITVELEGGVGPYQYAISPNLNQFSDENVFTDLAGSPTGITYTIIAQDRNGCFITMQYTITEPEVLAVTATALPELCAGEENGSIDLTISGGTAPYSTRFSFESNFVQDRTVLSDLAAGDYILFIRDAMGCDENIVVTIEAGVNLNATVETIYGCENNSPTNYINIVLDDNSIANDVLYALDSTDPADMQLNPFFRDTLPGSHYIAISHANGCIVTHSFETEDYEPLTISVAQSNVNELTATVNGGRDDYKIRRDRTTQTCGAKRQTPSRDR